MQDVECGGNDLTWQEIGFLDVARVLWFSMNVGADDELNDEMAAGGRCGADEMRRR